MQWLTNVGLYVGGVLPILTLVAMVAGGAAWVTRLVNRSRAALTQSIAEVVEPVADKVDRLDYQLHPNGGGSFFDKVGRIESASKAQAETLSYLTTRINAIITADDAAWYEMDEGTNVTAVNAAYLDLYDMTEREALTTLKWRDKIPPDDLARVDAEGARLVASTGSTWNTTFRVAHKGLLVPVRSTSRPVLVGDNHRGWIGTLVPMWKDAEPYNTDDPWPPPPIQPWTIQPRSTPLDDSDMMLP